MSLLKGVDIFVIGAFGSNNFGDDWLEGLLQTQNPQLRWVFLSKRSAVNHVNKRHFVSVFLALILAKKIFLGPGSLFQVISSKRQNFYYLALLCLAKLFRKKVIVFGLGIEPMPFWIQRCVVYALKGIKDIYVRDSYSYQLLQKNQIKAHQFADFAVLEPVKKQNLAQKQAAIKKIGICFSQIGKDQIEGMINDLRSEQVSVLWLAYCLPEEKPFAMHLAQTYGLTCVHIAYPDWLSRPVDVDVLISMRYHVCLWAYLSGIAFVSVGSQEKLHALALSCGMRHWNFWQKKSCLGLSDLCYDEARRQKFMGNQKALKHYCREVILAA